MTRRTSLPGGSAAGPACLPSVLSLEGAVEVARAGLAAQWGNTGRPFKRGKDVA
jgi:hypothetical protein